MILTEILNYILKSESIVTARMIMDDLNLGRIITDKYLSSLVKQGKIYRVGYGQYSKIKLNDYEIDRIRHNKLIAYFPQVYCAYSNAKKRCNNPNNKDYKHYGLKNIKVLITFPELVEIWLRDRGWEFQRPSIDRIDSKGSYTKENTRFTELKENVKRAMEEKKLKKTSLGEKNDLQNLQ
jgi:hypothetical protein